MISKIRAWRTQDYYHYPLAHARWGLKLTLHVITYYTSHMTTCTHSKFYTHSTHTAILADPNIKHLQGFPSPAFHCWHKYFHRKKQFCFLFTIHTASVLAEDAIKADSKQRLCKTVKLPENLNYELSLAREDIAQWR